jgi:hypothetical protein
LIRFRFLRSTVLVEPQSDALCARAALACRLHARLAHTARQGRKTRQPGGSSFTFSLSDNWEAADHRNNMFEMEWPPIGATSEDRVVWFDVDEARASSAQLSCGQGTLLLTLGATAGLVGIGFLPLFEVDVRPVRRYLILLRIAFPWLIRLLMRGAIGLLPRIIERRFTGVCVLGAFVVHDVPTSVEGNRSSDDAASTLPCGR